MKKIALFDIDKTIYNGYVVFPLAEYQLEKGIITKEERDEVLEDIKRLLEKFIITETEEPIIENHSEEVVEPRSNLTRIRERELELFVKYL